MEENSTDTDTAAIEQSTRTTNFFWAFIPAGITWFIGFSFLQEFNRIFVWWTLVCGWFPLYYAMKRKYPAVRKKWNIANGFAVVFLLVIPCLFSLLFTLFISQDI